MGRRPLPEREAAGEHLAGRVSLAKPQGRWVRGHVTGRKLPSERLRALRRDRQRLGVDERLVPSRSLRERESLLRAADAARRTVSAQGDQGRLAPVRAELLPPLPPRGSPG